MGTSTLYLEHQGTGESARSHSFVARAQEKQQIAGAQKASELKTLSLLAAFSDPSGKNPPDFLEKISSALQSGQNLRAALSQLPDSELTELHAKVGTEILPQLLSLSEESQEEMFFAGMLNLGQRLKASQDFEKASILLGMLSQNSPESIRSVALAEVQALQGQGSSALRSEVLLSRLGKDSCDWRAIAPMIGASIIGQVAGTAFMSRLATSPATSWFSRGWGLRFASGAVSFLAEFPAYASFNRLLAPQSDGTFSDELQRSALTIGVLKTFGFLGNQAFLKIHGFSEFGVPTRLETFTRFNQALFPQATMFAGLMFSHKLEERWGLRPHVDDATTATDTLASLVTLGAGSHLGHSILGRSFANFQQEMALRGEIYGNHQGEKKSSAPFLSEMLERIFPKIQRLVPAEGLPEGWMAMAAIEDSGIKGEATGSSQGSLGKPGTVRFPKINHSLSTYRKFAQESLMGDPLKNIRDRIAKKQGPVAILDIGSGKGIAVQEIKERFKDQVRVETNDLDPLVSEFIDQHHEGDFLAVDFQKQYDLAFAFFGAHAYPEGRLAEMVQKTSELLKPDGEFFATLNPSGFAEDFLLKDYDSFSKIHEALQLGWVLRLENVDGGKMLYMRRIGDSKVPDWSRLISRPNLSLSERSQEEMGKDIVGKLLKSDISQDGMKLRFEFPELEEISLNLARLGVPELLENPEGLARTLFERFLADFKRTKNRLPNDYEVGQWVAGREPSPLHRHPLLIDELIRARIEQAAEVKNPAAKFNEANSSSTPHIQINRQLFFKLSAVKTQVEGLPESNPKRHELIGRADRLLAMATELRPDSDFWPEIAQIHADLNRAWEATWIRRSSALLPAVEELAEKFPESSLKRRLIQLKERLASDGESAQDFRGHLDSLQEIFSLAIKETAEHFWRKSVGGDLPLGLRPSLARAVSGLLSCDLFSEALSAKVLEEFVETFAAFFRDFPPPPNSLMETITPDSTFTGHSLLGSKPDANGYLRNMTLNLQGYRELFGPNAGALFHREARLVSPIKSAEGEETGFSLVLEKGQYEVENGIKLSIFPFTPSLSQTKGELAKVGIHFGEKGTLRLVNIQGSYRTPFDEFENQRPIPLSTLLGSAHPLDMLIATAILLGRNAAYEKIEGIRDAAQVARLDLKGGKKGQGFYDLFFRRFGFKPPEDSEDFWSLKLQDLQIYRKARPPSSEHPPPSILDSDSTLSAQDYVAEILPRKNRDARGRNVRPEVWDRQAAAAEAPQVQAFWASVAPALSQLTWQAGPGRSLDRAFRPAHPRPFELGDLKSSLNDSQREFVARATEQMSQSDLSPEASQAFGKLLTNAQVGKVSGQALEIKALQILQHDWIAPLKAAGAEVVEYSLEHFLDELEHQKAPIPNWLAKLRGTPLGRNSKITEIVIEPAVQERYFNADDDGNWNLSTAQAYLTGLQDQMGLPAQSLAAIQAGERKVCRLLDPEFLFQYTRLVKGDQAMPYVVTPSLVSEEQMKSLTRKDIRPVVITPQNQEIHGVDGVRPYLAAIHDFFHLFRLNKYTVESRASLDKLHDIFLSMKNFEGDEELVETLIDKTPDGNPADDHDHRSLFREITNFFPSTRFLRALQKRLETVFSDTAHGREVLQAFYDELLKPNPEGGGSGPSNLLAPAALGIALLLTPKLSWAGEGAGKVMDHGTLWPLVAVGGLVLGGGLLSGYRWWQARNQHQPVIVEPWVEKNLRVSLEPEERKLLQPFFGGDPVPETMTGEDWKRIATPFARKIFKANGDKALIGKTEYYDLWVKIIKHIHETLFRGAPASPLVEADQSGEFGWSGPTRKDLGLLEEEVPTEPSLKKPPRKDHGGLGGLVGFGIGLSMLLHPDVADAATRLSQEASRHSDAESIAKIFTGGGLAMFFTPYGLWDLTKGLVRTCINDFLKWIGIRKDPPPLASVPFQKSAERKVETPRVKISPPETPPHSSTVQVSKAKRMDTLDDRGTPQLEVPPRNPGWIKIFSARMKQLLETKAVTDYEKEVVVDQFISVLFDASLKESEILDAAQAIWNISQELKLDSEIRQSARFAYIDFLQDPQRFPVGSPQVYREALRLRNLFSSSKYHIQSRVYAADAYGELASRFSTISVLGQGEGAIGAIELQALKKNPSTSLRKENRSLVDRAYSRVMNRFPTLKSKGN